MAGNGSFKDSTLHPSGGIGEEGEGTVKHSMVFAGRGEGAQYVQL